MAAPQIPYLDQAYHAAWLAKATWLVSYVDELTDVADALCIPAEMGLSRRALADMYRTIRDSFICQGDVSFWDDVMWPFLSTHQWQHHEQSVADTLRETAAILRSIEDGNVPSCAYHVSDITSLAECVMHFYKVVLRPEGLACFFRMGQPMLWFPVDEAHGLAFALALVLHMLSQTQINPPYVSKLYADALRYLSSFRCETCHCNLPQIGSACEVCPTLEDGEIREFPWGVYVSPGREREEELITMLSRGVSNSSR
jgi:hypothetical protein